MFVFCCCIFYFFSFGIATCVDLFIFTDNKYPSNELDMTHLVEVYCPRMIRREGEIKKRGCELNNLS